MNMERGGRSIKKMQKATSTSKVGSRFTFYNITFVSSVASWLVIKMRRGSRVHGARSVQRQRRSFRNPLISRHLRTDEGRL